MIFDTDSAFAVADVLVDLAEKLPG